MTGVEAADALGARGEYVVEFDGKGGSVVRDLVVRCRDCEHAFPSPWTDERVAGILRCDAWCEGDGVPVEPDGYCNMAEEAPDGE